MENKIISILYADAIADLCSETISDWHKEELKRSPDYIIVNENIRKIRSLNDHRSDFRAVIDELIRTNSEIWHEEDKVRSDNDATVLKAIRNINPLNQHRNDLIEELDEIILEAHESQNWKWEK